MAVLLDPSCNPRLVFHPEIKGMVIPEGKLARAIAGTNCPIKFIDARYNCRYLKGHEGPCLSFDLLDKTVLRLRSVRLRRAWNFREKFIRTGYKDRIGQAYERELVLPQNVVLPDGRYDIYTGSVYSHAFLEHLRDTIFRGKALDTAHTWTGCPERSPDKSWICTRPDNHPGCHVAFARTQILESRIPAIYPLQVWKGSLYPTDWCNLYRELGIVEGRDSKGIVHTPLQKRPELSSYMQCCSGWSGEHRKGCPRTVK